MNLQNQSLLEVCDHDLENGDTAGRQYFSNGLKNNLEGNSIN